MELTHDWSGFRKFFSSPVAAAPLGSASAPLSIVISSGQILAARAGAENFTHWAGMTLDEVKPLIGDRKLTVYNAEQIDKWMSSASELPHFFEQKEFLKSECKLEDEVPHFFLEALQGWWAKVFPSSYAVFFRLEKESDGAAEQDLLLILRKGKIESFYRPDFSWMGAEKARQPEHVVKFLSEKHLMPVQGLFLTHEEWSSWCKSEAPWKKIAASIQTHRSKLVPFRWSLASLIATRAFLNV